MKTIFKGIGFGLGFYVGKTLFDIGTVIVARKVVGSEMFKQFVAKSVAKTMTPDA